MKLSYIRTIIGMFIFGVLNVRTTVDNLLFSYKNKKYYCALIKVGVLSSCNLGQTGHLGHGSGVGG